MRWRLRGSRRPEEAVGEQPAVTSSWVAKSTPSAVALGSVGAVVAVALVLAAVQALNPLTGSAVGARPINVAPPDLAGPVHVPGATPRATPTPTARASHSTAAPRTAASGSAPQSSAPRSRVVAVPAAQLIRPAAAQPAPATSSPAAPAPVQTPQGGPAAGNGGVQAVKGSGTPSKPTIGTRAGGAPTGAAGAPGQTATPKASSTPAPVKTTPAPKKTTPKKTAPKKTVPVKTVPVKSVPALRPPVATPPAGRQTTVRVGQVRVQVAWTTGSAVLRVSDSQLRAYLAMLARWEPQPRSGSHAHSATHSVTHPAAHPGRSGHADRDRH